MQEPYSVRSKLNYTLDNGLVPEYYFYQPAADVVVNPPGNDTREVEIHNGWDQAAQFSVDREGFMLRPCPIAFDCWGDDHAVRKDFFASVTSFMREHLGARRVHVFDYNVRSKAFTAPTTSAANPVRLVHSDYTPLSGPQRLRDVLPEEADDLQTRRFAFFNLWKPINRRVEELPLAVCDVGSTVAADLLPMKLRYPDRTGEIYAMRHSTQHHWVYFPRMETSQALLLKCYDSELDGRARFMAHSAFEDPSSPADAPTRESIEIRTMAFF